MKKFSYLFIVTIIVFLISFYPKIDSVLRVAFLLGFTILCWITSLIPEWLSVFILFTGCSIGKLVPVNVYMSGFYSAATWLILAGLILGAMITFVGLDEYIAGKIQQIFHKSYSNILLGTLLIGTIFIFLMPSAMGRVLIILPILSAFAKKIGYEKGSKEEEGIILIGLLSTYLPAFAVLPANVPNNVLLGSMQSLYNIHFTYISYFLDFFMILGFAKLLILYVLFLILYKNCKSPLNICKGNSLTMNRQQKNASFLLLVTMILWITEKWHGISVGWVGMLASIICALPGSGLLMKKPLRSIGFESFFYIAGIISLGNIARHTEIATKISNYFIEQFSVASMGNYGISILWITLGIVIGLIVTVPGIPAILTPLAANFSEMSSLSILTLCKLQVLSFSNIFFPYQAPPLVVALQETGVSKAKTTGICIAVSLINILFFSNILLYLWKII
ncbi:SLC13 family permease [Fusobacterium necrophorum]|uniref:Carboxylate transporter n=2 Tax=Fusobacterium necrophorum TaxID=859 RepID=A0A4Q2KZX6_9FUSO|nr:SLC13 family permease [Fusobacterium necrophorum]EYD70128.1 putative integral membrane protein [Fusobacterium necrophorum subsp. funduliforme B35]MBR8733395.1 hypothetical protein [Fusobacterium necrophorum]MBR8789572.1 hypothetical protein [Fusobacterium necrophorum]MDK4522280.1 anion permease [Fusobacterium necrophorum]RXZ28744.1 carboxylate transporter [Fusobacterium necrophorum]